MSSAIPRPRRAAVGTFIDGCFYLFGGCLAGDKDYAKLSNGLWKFDPQENEWEMVLENDGTLDPNNMSRPSARRFPGVASYRNNLVIMGGCSQDSQCKVATFLNDIWFYSCDKGWKKVKKNRFDLNFDSREPIGRYTNTIDIYLNKIYLFGGWYRFPTGQRKRYWLNDLWRYDIKNGEWFCLERYKDIKDYSSNTTRPANRYGQKGFIYNGEFYIFGGHGNYKDHNDFWKYNIGNDEWIQLNPDTEDDSLPKGRYGFTFVEIDDIFYLFGGRSRQNPDCQFNDLWAYYPSNNSWELLESQSKVDRPRYIGKNAYGVYGKEIYLFMGEIYNENSDSIYQYNGIWSYSTRKKEWKRISNNDSQIFVLGL